MKTFPFSVFLLATVCAAGCATTSESGHAFDHAKADQLVRGKSTKADALALLGPATGSQSLPDGRSQLVFTHSTVRVGLLPVGDVGATSWEECRVGFDSKGLYSGTECNQTGSAPTR